MSYESDLKRALELGKAGDHDESYRITDRYLRENPNDPKFLANMTWLMLNTGKPTLGYVLAKRVAELLPNDAGAWLNVGMAANDLWQSKEAERAYKRGLRLAPEDSRRSMLYINLGSLYVDTGRFEEGYEACKKAIEYNPETVKGKANLGFCQLALREWVPGWENYRYCIGSEWRPRITYNDEPMWDGKSKGTIVISGEQGLGDEVSGASVIPDLQRWAAKNDSRIILECDRRLEGLFRRSFPDVEVYGTRNQKKVKWDPTEVDYSLPIMQLGEYFRHTDKDFSGKKYLTPDPDRTFQWKALFRSKRKPVIGIAWRSGIPKTGAKFRSMDLEQLLPVLKSVDAHWVSLQYKPASEEIAAFREAHPEIDLVEYPHGTLTGDYDDTVAMVSALDMCVIMHTSVGHVAGGLGVPCWTFVPKNSQWRYGAKGEDFVWAKSVRILRQTEQGEWSDLIEKTAGELDERFRSKKRLSNRDHAPQRKQLPKKGHGRCTNKDTHGTKAAAYNGASQL
jgi:tetratricopeptide (TPR) repeat protein